MTPEGLGREIVMTIAPISVIVGLSIEIVVEMYSFYEVIMTRCFFFL